MYAFMRTKVYKELNGNGSRIALTIEMCTLNQKKEYVAITTHSIDDEWKMQKRLIR